MLRTSLRAAASICRRSVRGSLVQSNHFLEAPCSRCWLLQTEPASLVTRKFLSDVPVTGLASIQSVQVSEDGSQVAASDSDTEREPQNFNPIKSTSRRNEPQSTFSESDEITVTGRDAPKPFMHFNDFEWPEEITRYIEKNGFRDPTPIQCQAMPVALEGRDLIGIAQTGSGKTLGFILPMIVNLKTTTSGRQQNPTALVLCPTRELAQQIQSVARQFPSLRSVCVFGGARKSQQLQEIAEYNPVLVIATPGRLNDIVDSGFLSVKDIRYLVLDEADRMLDMGFEPQIRSIIQDTPKDRQTLMWSATWPREIRDLAHQFLRDPIHISVGGTELRANHDIRQIVEVMDRNEKLDRLMDILDKVKQEKSLVFCQTKATVDFIVKILSRRGLFAAGIHSDRSQMQRDQILSSFRRGRPRILVATDVAARGLDVNDISTVVNYDYPNGSEDYIHRIGRTGRAGKTGTAYTLMTDVDMAQAEDLIKVLEEAKQDVAPELRRLAQMARQTKAVKKNFRGFARDAQNMAGKYDNYTRSQPRRDFDRSNRVMTRSDFFPTRTRTTRFAEGGRPINYDEDPSYGTGGRYSERFRDNDRPNSRRGHSRDYDHDIEDDDDFYESPGRNNSRDKW